MNKKGISCVLSGLLFLSPSLTFSLEKTDIYNEILNSFEARDEHNDYLLNFLVSKGITEKEYVEYTRLINLYKDSTESIWYQYESGLLIFDDILLSHPEIVEVYNNIYSSITLDTTLHEKKQITMSMLKKNLNINVGLVEKLYEESLKKHADLSKIFEKRFNRKITEKEAVWIKSKKDMNKSLYGGMLGAEVNKSYQAVIEKGNGHIFFAIDDEDRSKYDEFLKLQDKIEKIEQEYRKIYSLFDVVRDEINNKYLVDIFQSLSDKERENILKESIYNNFEIDYDKMYNLCTELLTKKGLIEKENIITPNNPEVGDGIKEDNTVGKPGMNQAVIYEEYKKTDIYKLLNSDAGEFYTKVPKNKRGVVLIKYNNIEYETGIVIEDDKVTKEEMQEIIKKIESLLEIKTVLAKQKMMVLINREIKICPISEIKEDEIIEFETIKKFFKSFEIDLYQRVIQEKTEVEI